ncbi:dephospho-CoA kinase [Algibacillus agarilyticus]|uniref:dephospho-CoA kinase n=1 Tax=Algibacillus agarilyticus TaxID=2234133 RepID=UPI000DCFB46E|nr:dephospho-CoA kinase [Algibacillus agarilyticus]
MSALRIGLTGGIGSGKTAATQIFADNKISIVDADMVARDVVDIGTPSLDKIAQRWGQKILNADGTLNRAELRHIIFNSPTDKQWLNALLHPIINQTMQQQIAKANSAYVIVAVPLLIENKSFNLCDRVLVIDCPESLQIERAMQRDGNTQKLIESIIKSQASRTERQALADDIIENDTSLALLKQKINKLHEFYLSMI